MGKTMRLMESGYSATKLNTTRHFDLLKTNQADANSRLASDVSAVVGTADPDQVAFLTPALKDYRAVQASSGNNTVGTLAMLPRQQYASLEDRYYKSGTAVALDRVGSPTAGFNIMRPGHTPDGYYGADKVLVQKRTKLFPAGEDNADIFFYAQPQVRPESRDYVLQEDERYDGNFYPGKVMDGAVRPFGTTFPTGPGGGYAYNGNPFKNEGWNGQAFEVTYNRETLPVIEAIDPNYFTLPDTRAPGENIVLTITGSNLLNGLIMVGPYAPAIFNGGGGSLSESEVQINMPVAMNPGVYDVYIIGYDGQIGALQQGFTVYAEGNGP
jgi:hypothetical protein